MPFAAFAEKSFETAYFGEISRGLGGGPRLFSPTQVLEKILGFDAAVDPLNLHAVWKVLGVPRPPGISLLPGHWTGSRLGEPRAAALPTEPVSLILQYKRPEYLRGARAAQWALWGEPYYRFTRDEAQHAVLKRLELNLAGLAVVRYASPAFHTPAEFEFAQATSSVIQKTGHVAPTVLAGHRVWTYKEPGNAGRGNPDGPWKPFDPFDGLFEYADPDLDGPSGSRDVQLFDGLREHLKLVAAVARHREPTLRRSVESWQRRLVAEGLHDSVNRALVDFVTIQSLLARVGADWLIADGSLVRPAK